jgi:hypothetical protein
VASGALLSAPLGDWPVSGLSNPIPLAFPLDGAVAMEQMGARFELESVEARAGRLPLRGQHRFCRHGASGFKRKS